MLVTAGTKRGGMDGGCLYAGRPQAQPSCRHEIQMRSLAATGREGPGRKARRHLGPYFVAAGPNRGSEHGVYGRRILKPPHAVFENPGRQATPAGMKERNTFRRGQKNGNANNAQPIAPAR